MMEGEKIKEEQQKKVAKQQDAIQKGTERFLLKSSCLLCTKRGEQAGHSYEMCTKAFVKTEF